jgi:hypothetical protein
VFEHHLCDSASRELADFLCVHNRFDNPQFIIDNEHITLMMFTENSAVFAVAREKGKHLN